MATPERESTNRRAGVTKIPVLGSELRKSFQSTAIKNLFRKKASRKDCLTVEQIWEVATRGENPGTEFEASNHLQTCRLCREELDYVTSYVNKGSLKEDFERMLQKAKQQSESDSAVDNIVEKIIKKLSASARALGKPLFHSGNK